MAEIENLDEFKEPDNDEGGKTIKLTEKQLKRIKNNKEKALLLRKARIANLSTAEKAVCQKKVNVTSQPRDTGGGFFLEDDDDVLNFENQIITQAPAPLLTDKPICLECNNEFNDSYLQIHFDYHVCDDCRDNEGNHCLISKTDAKKEYLLKDCDIDKREPLLKYILRKNPHNRYGNMKLYLRLQIEKRALEVHGSEEAIEEKREERQEVQLQRKQKAFDKKVKALRMELRSSLFRKKDTTHTHVYGPEVHKDDDIYEKTCTTCGHKVEFEKM